MLTILAIVGGVVLVVMGLVLALRGGSASRLPTERPKPRPLERQSVSTPTSSEESSPKAKPAPAVRTADPAPTDPAGFEDRRTDDITDELNTSEIERGDLERPTEELALPPSIPAESQRPFTSGPPKSSLRPQVADDEPVQTLRRSLKGSRSGWIAKLAGVFARRTPIDESAVQEIEELLIGADVGVRTTQKLVERLRDRAKDTGIEPSELWAVMRDEATKILAGSGGALRSSGTPTVVLVVGVNGAGKTTTIGKLAHRLAGQKKKVVLAAGDTFRAAAVLQLEVWGRRVGCTVVKGKEGTDPSSVIFDAIKVAQTEGADFVLADTAGRLHTKAPLMDELRKVGRTVEKALGRAADETILVLDATSGQNAVQQAALFKEALPLTGLALTKLDGTAKGGVVLGIVDEHGVPVRYVGLGEKVDDLREFDPSSFVEALFGKPEDDSAAA